MEAASTMTTHTMTFADIRQHFATLRAQGKRHRDAAEALGLSEAEAIAAHAGVHDLALQATPLRSEWLELLQALERCGTLLALTRNRSTVHEKTGVYEKVSGGGHVAIALGEAIDLRLFLNRWHAGFAITEGASLSLQFFDSHGLAVHKIFSRDGTDRGALQSIIARYAAPALEPVFTPVRETKSPRTDALIDTIALTSAWAAMRDTHEFFGLLNMQGRFTQRVGNATVRAMLHEAAFDGLPIMVFVGSPGCIQIHTGPVVRVEPMETGGARWLNVLDAGFNLHMREDMIDAVWIVEKPTSDGVVTSVEVFDDGGELMAMFFGARKPGMPEREDWRALVRRLPRAEMAA